MSSGPDLASMLAESALGGAPAPAAGGPPPGPADPMMEGGGDRTPVSVIEEMLEHAKMLLQLSQEYDSVEQDAIDRKTMADVAKNLAQVQSTLVGYHAEQQKQEESAMGTSPASKYVRRTLGGV